MPERRRESAGALIDREFRRRSIGADGDQLARLRRAERALRQHLEDVGASQLGGDEDDRVLAVMEAQFADHPDAATSLPSDALFAALPAFVEHTRIDELPDSERALRLRITILLLGAALRACGKPESERRVLAEPTRVACRAALRAIGRSAAGGPDESWMPRPLGEEGLPW